MPMVQLPWQILSRTMDGNNDSFSLNNSNLARFGRNLFNLWWTRVCGAYPENQVRRQKSSYREIFYQPPETGEGLGSQALRKFVSLAFENEDIDTISLNVYEANQRAYNLYQKEGFEIVQMVETPIRKYIMKKGR